MSHDKALYKCMDTLLYKVQKCVLPNATVSCALLDSALRPRPW